MDREGSSIDQRWFPPASTMEPPANRAVGYGAAASVPVYTCRQVCREERDEGTKMKYLAFLLLLPLLAGCVEDTSAPLETDIAESNRNEVCPADVSEADRAEYPACN